MNRFSSLCDKFFEWREYKALLLIVRAVQSSEFSFSKKKIWFVLVIIKMTFLLSAYLFSACAIRLICLRGYVTIATGKQIRTPFLLKEISFLCSTKLIFFCSTPVLLSTTKLCFWFVQYKTLNLCWVGRSFDLFSRKEIILHVRSSNKEHGLQSVRFRTPRGWGFCVF